MVECTPRGGSEVNVIFTDNTSRVVKLANENQSLKDKVRFNLNDNQFTVHLKPRFDATLDYSQKHKPLLRTMSERTHSDHGRFMNSDSLVMKKKLSRTKSLVVCIISHSTICSHLHSLILMID